MPIASPYSCSVSILSSPLGMLASTVKMLQRSSAASIHFDVMDGHFVPNLTFGFQTIAQLRSLTSKAFDVHLMIANPGSYIKNYVEAGAEIISIHREIPGGVNRVMEVLQQIKSCGVKASLAYNPDTPLDVQQFLPHISRVLLMSVHPGFGGQKFIANTLTRADEVNEIMKTTRQSVELQVDGGVNASNYLQLKQHGFTNLVAGSYVVNNFPYEDATKQQQAFEKVEAAISLLQAPL